jgi:hypothetical protein
VDRSLLMLEKSKLRHQKMIVSVPWGNLGNGINYKKSNYFQHLSRKQTVLRDGTSAMVYLNVVLHSQLHLPGVSQFVWLYDCSVFNDCMTEWIGEGTCVNHVLPLCSQGWIGLC